MQANTQPDHDTDIRAPVCLSDGPPPANSAKALFPSEGTPVGIPEYEAVIEKCSASFAQLAASIFYGRARFTQSFDERAVYMRYIAPLTEAFEAAHGHITHSFYCETVMAAAVLTDRQELCVIPPPLHPDIIPIAEMIFECQRLDTEADRVLAGPKRLLNLQTTKTLVYGVLANLLSRLDDSNQPPPRGVIDLHWREVKQAQEYYRRAANIYAQFDYFLGMLMGTTVPLALVIIAMATIFFTPEFVAEGRILIGCLTAGGVGAVLSVMSRMTFGGLSLDYEAGRRILTMLGGFRPVIGMALGAAMWVLTGSGVLSVVPSDPSKGSFFRVLTAFLAGFSERWAQDMLGRTAEQIGGRGITSRSRENEVEYKSENGTRI